ncbi:uncharacterized protein BJ212DRAFT_1296318 [Suillus subaureus]|uniref:Uncharacterized protein n=1 Tax=Suillus subaureus TaxID=48587 RepID=A0A9P7EJL7_9AGAM|nr:uncharacterized protein BJ212DRAFT_1296318 [Suillus subaureus]KAG1823764.1 hypothetical protein BJ212DRAFT_1296318 [Suillus subaureus]
MLLCMRWHILELHPSLVCHSTVISSSAIGDSSLIFHGGHTRDLKIIHDGFGARHVLFPTREIVGTGHSLTRQITGLAIQQVVPASSDLPIQAVLVSDPAIDIMFTTVPRPAGSKVVFYEDPPMMAVPSGWITLDLLDELHRTIEQEHLVLNMRQVDPCQCLFWLNDFNPKVVIFECKGIQGSPFKRNTGVPVKVRKTSYLIVPFTTKSISCAQLRKTLWMKSRSSAASDVIEEPPLW